MKERPILFSSAMVQAILGGHKTQTRRVMKPQPYLSTSNPPMFKDTSVGDVFICPDLIPTGPERGWVIVECTSLGTYRCMGQQQFAEAHCPYGIPGDKLWVRETWMRYEPYPTIGDDGRKLSLPDSERVMAESALRDYWLKRVVYGADAEGTDYLSLKPGRFDEVWRPSIHMPRWASRLTLDILNVRVERLQDISDANCRAEGCNGGNDSIPGYEFSATPREHYKHLWDSINGKKHPWASNPWVWVVEFSISKAAE